MKKAFVLALAAIAFAGSTVAHAAPEGRGKGLRAIEGMRNRETRDRAARNAAPTVAVHADSIRIQNNIQTSGLRISSQATAELTKLATNPTMKAAIDGALANKAASPEIVTAQLNALSLIGSAQGTPAAKETAMDLIVGAGTKAVKWPDAKAKGNVQFMIERTSEYLSQRKTADEALRLAKEDLHKEKGVDVDLAKIKDLCK